MRDMIIVGAGKMGELLAACLEEECGVRVKAFCVDEEYKEGDLFCGKALLSFDRLPESHPPHSHDLIVAIGYADCNQARLDIMRRCLGLGYSLGHYISPRAVLPPSFKPEANTVIFEGAIIQRFAVLGKGVIVWPGAVICHHARLEDGVFVGPGATICGCTHIGERALIGAGAVVRDFLQVGRGAIVGAGSTLLRDLPDNALCNGGESPVRLNKARSIKLWPPKTGRD